MKAGGASCSSSSSRGVMELEEEEHVVIFPCPAQGHVNSMLILAQLLCLRNLHVTFLNTQHIHQRLTRFARLDSLLARHHPRLHFETIPDGLPHDHPRSGVDALLSVKAHCKTELRHILVSPTRVSCLIADGYFGGVANEVGDQVGVPVIYFRTISASAFWAYFSVPTLFQSNDLPIRGEEDMDRVIANIPGMENLLRCRDLPSFCRQTIQGQGESKPTIPLEDVVFETQQSLRARALILNTFDHLESPVLSQMRSHHFPNLFTIGPLHALLANTAPFSNNSLWEEDSSCMTWLDSQPSRSVLYVSFGSITTMAREDLIEMWYGLVNSKRRFLWVVRGDMVAGELDGHAVPAELVEGTKERGLMVSWAPQAEVLAHWAVGGFLTHSGWNSTLESVAAGVPMICWPYFADQQVNSRLVSEAWKVGLDMKDSCDRTLVEHMVNDLLLRRRDHFLESAKGLADLAHISVSQGGSSHSNLDRLINFIKSIAHPSTS